MSRLLISVRFYDGRYHGSGEWPPSPWRLFQALVASAARGESLPDRATEALRWLEGLGPPTVCAPSAYAGRSFKTFVPNNDLDAVGGDPARVGEIRTAKTVQPRIFDPAASLFYLWAFAQAADSERHARKICEVADQLYQLGRGVDMAWARGEICDEGEADERLCQHVGLVYRPAKGGSGAVLQCPHFGSLASLTTRFAAAREQFKIVRRGSKAGLLFSQAPKPSFSLVPYDSPSVFLLFDIRKADSGAFAAEPVERIIALTEEIRKSAAARLRRSGWRRDDSRREDYIEKVFTGRDSTEADKARRIRITPLPSIGHAHTERSIRRVLVAVPPDCPIATADIAWAFSGAPVKHDQETGEILHELALTADRTMLSHYGVEDAPPMRLWRTITAAALPERVARRRTDPRRTRGAAKGGAERLREHAAAEMAARQALRHAGVDTPVEAVRVQREPFEAPGRRAEAFESKPRFAKERLWHVEIALSRPRCGPLLLGDGRYLGLGLMAPVRRVDGMFAFAVADGLADQAEPLELARALRRAIMARVHCKMRSGARLPVFFSGHAEDGAPARSGGHEHLAFLFDAPRKRLAIIAPHILERRDASKEERDYLCALAEALEDFHELRAGRAGRLSLCPSPIETPDDPLFGRSSAWRTLTPYRVMRHAKLSHAAAAFEADLLAECRRDGLPKPSIEVSKVFGKPGLGLFGVAKLKFHGAVEGPLLLGRDRHFGGGLFVAAE